MATVLSPSPFAISSREPLSGLEDWRLVVELLGDPDPDLCVYTPKEICAVLGGVGDDALRLHIRDIWPDWEGHFRLSYEQAVRLIKRYCKFGRRCHTRAALEALVLAKRAASAF